MILSSDDYRLYLESDRLALDRAKLGFFGTLKNLVAPDYIWNFQQLLRKLEYYKNVKNNNFIEKLIYQYFRLRFKSLSLKMGFTIPVNVFGPGLAIVHYGTIVVNANAKVGSNCRIHACTNIGSSGGSNRAPHIGDNVYIGPGVKIVGDICIASNTAIGANSVVIDSFDTPGMLIAGIPANIIKSIDITRLIKVSKSLDGF